MAIAFVIGGLVLLVAGVRGQQDVLFSQLKADVIGGHFVWWIVAILAVSSVGYVKALKPVSDAFLVLIILVLALHNHGFFTQFISDIQAIQSGDSQA